MKIYLLSYNSITNNYNLDYGCFGRDRENLGNLKGKNSVEHDEILAEKIKEILHEKGHLHRKIMIYSEMTFKNSIKELLSNSFKNTPIKVEFVKNLENVCKENKTQKI